MKNSIYKKIYVVNRIEVRGTACEDRSFKRKRNWKNTRII